MQALLVTQPLSAYMDRVSWVETAQARARLKAQGLRLEQSRCAAGSRDVALMNLQLLSGEAGLEVVAAYDELFRAHQDHDCWYRTLGVRKEDALNLLFLAVGDSWRRLVLPFQCLPWQFLRLVTFDGKEALDFAYACTHQHGTCDRCRDDLFTQAGSSGVCACVCLSVRACALSILLRARQVFAGWLLAPQVSEETRLHRLRRLQILFEDLLCVIPSTSVEVERQHANLQVDVEPGFKPKQPSTVQSCSYLMSTVLAHSKLREEVEKECFGEGKARVRRVLSSRATPVDGPAVSMRSRARQIAEDGTVKRRTGLLKGMLSRPQTHICSCPPR